MASNDSSLFNHQYYNNHIESFETSIPHMESTSKRARVVNDQYLISPFNLASSSSSRSSDAFSYFPNRQEGSIPFHNDLPSEMEAFAPSRESTCDQQNVNVASYASPYIPSQHNFTWSMPKMGVESLPNMASSSSCGHKLTGLWPFQNNMSGLMDLEGTDGVDELEELNGVVPSNNMPSQFGFAQGTRGSGHEPKQTCFNGLRPCPKDMPSTRPETSGFPQKVGDRESKLDLDRVFDLEGLTEWLERDEQLHPELTNDGAYIAESPSASNSSTQENANVQSTTDNGLQLALPRWIKATDISNGDAVEFGKYGLVMVPIPETTSWEPERLKTSKIIQSFDATFHLSQNSPNFLQARNAVNVTKRNRKPLPLPERLEGWTVNFRRRVKGTHETVYYHENSKRTFRSKVEVENFILFDIYPSKAHQRKPKASS